MDINLSTRKQEVRPDSLQDQMESWKKRNVKVHDLYHWPGVSNVTDLAT